MCAAEVPEEHASVAAAVAPGGAVPVSASDAGACPPQTCSASGLVLNGDRGQAGAADKDEKPFENFVYVPGVARIRKEYLIKPGPRVEAVDDDALENRPASTDGNNQGNNEGNGKKGGRGQNKGRKFMRNRDEIEFCPFLETPNGCTHTECKYTHDREAYIKHKPADIGPRCILSEIYGECRYGIRCRFAGAHTKDGGDTVDEEKRARSAHQDAIPRGLTGDLLRQLRKRSYEYKRVSNVLKQLDAEAAKLRDEQKSNVERQKAAQAAADGQNDQPVVTADTEAAVAPDGLPIKRRKVEGGGVTVAMAEDESSAANETERIDISSDNGQSGAAGKLLDASSEGTTLRPDHFQRCIEEPEDTGIAGFLPREKKTTIDFTDKLYLAPLTTVGNLPFRRLCKMLGADITCGEMAMAQQIIMGHKAEWALLKRHPSEDIFGVQITGNKPDQMIKAAELISEHIDCDFVDVNMGCPIDLVYKQGAGSALMETPGKLGRILRGMDAVLDVPLTIKLRMGVHTDHPIAHKLMPKIRNWGCVLGTLHGRSRQQRYTKLANWDYIGECVKASSPMPLFGNGDVLSFREYYEKKEQTGVAGIMLGRGPLVKPWLFTEIKERRDWDISATERLEFFRKFCDFGLDHWGSDTVGVNATRRFLCEWQSFTHRYIPLGILEHGYRPSMNDRPPLFNGRNELECLLASTDAADWVKVSEIFLGKAPDTFTFVPKHKANFYNVNQG